MLRLWMRDGVEDTFSMVGVRSPRTLIDRHDLIFADGEHDSVGSMPHGLDTISKIVVPVIGEMLFGEYFAFELKISDEGIGFHVLIILEEDVVLDFHGNL